MKLIYQVTFLKLDTFLVWEVVHLLPNHAFSYWMWAPLCQIEAFFSFPDLYQPIQRTQRFDQIRKEDYEQSWKWMQEFWSQVLYLCLINYSLMWISLQEDQPYTPQIISAQSKGIRCALADLGQQENHHVLITEVDDALHLGLEVLLLI